MSEPVVTLTDYALAAECACFALLLRRAPTHAALRRWLVLFFVAASAAPLLGGTVHGFFPEPHSAGHRLLWPASLLAVGVASLAGVGIGSSILFPDRRGARITGAAGLLLVLYASGIGLGSQEFRMAIAAYLPAALYLLVAFWVAHRRGGRRSLLLGSGGLGLTFVASAIQQLRLGIHPVYFDHNAAYHVVQGIALAAIFLASRALVASTSPGSKRRSPRDLGAAPGVRPGP